MSTTNADQKRATGSEGFAIDARQPYEPPRIVKRRSLTRVTLFSGTGVSSVGFVGAPSPESCAQLPRPPGCP